MVKHVPYVGRLKRMLIAEREKNTNRLALKYRANRLALASRDTTFEEPASIHLTRAQGMHSPMRQKSGIHTGRSK